MRQYTMTLTAGDQRQLHATGSYLYILDAAGDLAIQDNNNSVNVRVPPGFGIPGDRWETLYITSQINQTVTLLVGTNRPDNNRVAGSIDSVQIAPENATGHGSVAVGTTAAQIIGTAGRRTAALVYADDEVFVSPDSAVTTSSGIPVPAGATYRHESQAPLYAIAATSTTVRINEEHD